jgi:hypothetical protein
MNDLQRQFQEEAGESFDGIPINGLHLKYIIWLEEKIQALPVYGVMQAEGSDGADGAAVGQRSVDTGVRVRNKSGDENCEDCTYPNCFCGG